jgi:putative ABC transport system permease protein
MTATPVGTLPRWLFPLRMAWRETRAAWLRLVFFFLCVALGVAAIVVLRSVVQDVRIALTSEARVLVGADIVVQSTRPWTPTQRDAIAAVVKFGHTTTTSDVIETQTMASVGGPEGAVRLVEVRAVSEGFPFYGGLDLDDGRPFDHAMLRDHGVLAPPELLATLGLHVGDAVRLAGQTFTIRGVIAHDRIQRIGNVPFGPRVYMDLEDLQATKLLGFGSRATYQVYVRAEEHAIPADITAFKAAFAHEAVSVRSWQGVEDTLGRNLTLAENDLSLVGFAIVVLGGIGVWSVTRVFVQQKTKSVAILKCVGARSGTVLATYVLQVTWLALCGSLVGVVAAAVTLRVIPARLLAFVSLTSATITWSAAAQGVAVGLLVSLLFAVVPLLEMRRVKPLLLLRADTASTARKRDWRSYLTGAAIATGVVLVAIWQADSVRAGVIVSVGLGVLGAILLGVGRLLIWAVRPLTRSKRFALRHAMVSLGRPGNQTAVILLAVGLGAFFILGVRAVQENLLAEFDQQIGRNTPDLVLIDIQPDQVDGVRDLTTARVAAPSLVPMMRARVVAVDGAKLHLPTAEDVRQQGDLTREFGITYRAALQDNERITEGHFWPGPLAGEKTFDGADTEVSVEEIIAKHTGIAVGDLIRFDVAGRVLQARVTSIRTVAWDEAQNGGFVFVFRPGPAIERAPHTFVGFLEVGTKGASVGPLERDLATKFPNVSAIDVRQVLATVRDVVSNATLGVTVVGAVTVAGGILILTGAVAMTKFQRLYDAAIYRALGAGTRRLAAMAAIEYGLLGLLAGLIGAAGAVGLSWAVAKYLFDIDWHPTAGLMASGVAFTAVTVGLVGLVASADVLVRKPLGTLRRE